MAGRLNVHLAMTGQNSQHAWDETGFDVTLEQHPHPSQPFQRKSAVATRRLLISVTRSVHAARQRTSTESLNARFRQATRRRHFPNERALSSPLPGHSHPVTQPGPTAQAPRASTRRTRTSTCVLALQIAHLMRLKADRAGLHLSVRQLLRQLAGISETVLIYPSTGGRPKARRMLTETDNLQNQLATIFQLDRWAPAVRS